MSRVNILLREETEKLVLTEGALQTEIASLKVHSSTGRVNISIDRDTVLKYPAILQIIDSCISKNKEYKNTIFVQLQDMDEDSKNEMILSSPVFLTGKRITTVVKHAPQLNIKHLNFTMNLESPEYLLMSNGTLSLLKNATLGIDKKRIESRDIFYHTYLNIPIAITELLDPGIIEIVRLVKCDKKK